MSLAASPSPLRWRFLLSHYKEGNSTSSRSLPAIPLPLSTSSLEVSKAIVQSGRTTWRILRRTSFPSAERDLSYPIWFFGSQTTQVYPAAHEIVDGMERCACRFAVQWSDGPRAGSMEEVGIERVCCVQSSPVQDPVLMEFLDGVTKLAGDANVETVSQEIHVAPVVKGGVPANALQTRHRDFNGKFGPASRQAV
ncbi:uncharacterized protein [Zea mays]|uniref:uncharacterized protein isoform X6 n=1 Tax=Zea mays TaxID=4577 RepID=UPI001652427B|nr:uncharacterized protein LOC100280017 isoform X6 [Zea mays]